MLWFLKQKRQISPADVRRPEIRRTAGGYAVDSNGGATVAFVYFVDGREMQMAGQAPLAEDEACRIASGIARLPDLLRHARAAARMIKIARGLV